MSAQHTEEFYLAEFVDGPVEGESERRVLIRGKYDQRVSVIAAIDGLESTFWYDAINARDINGELHVHYRFDAPDSDPVESEIETF